MSMKCTAFPKPLLFGSLVISFTLAGCATTTPDELKNDPWTGWNHGTQTFNDNLDKAIIKPLAQGYEWITPTFVNEGVTNFFSNINDVGVTINDLLQFKVTQSGMDASRFLINTTAGVAGFIDVADMVNLPKHKEDFGQTLGFWGVPSGNYLVLPFFGPSSPRDTVGLIGDALFNPLTYVSIFGGAAINAATAGAKLVDVVDQRDHLMTTEKIIDEGSIDRYDFIKNSYQQNREYYIHDGEPFESSDPDLDDESSDSTGKTPGTSNGTKDTGAGNKKSGNTLDLSEPK